MPGIAVGADGFPVDVGCVGSEPFQGVVPGATLIGVKVLDAGGLGTLSDVIAGTDYWADAQLEESVPQARPIVLP